MNRSFARVALLSLLAFAAPPAFAGDEPPKVAGRPAVQELGKDIVIAEPPAGAENLIRNGSFEDANEKKDGPAHWQAIDNLCWFWATDPAAPDRGKVMRIDTDVVQKQAYAWWVERFLHDKPLSDAPKKTPPVGEKYDTIAGLDGAFYWSDFIPVKEGGAYKVYVDAKGPLSMVFIRGYEEEVPISFGDDNPAVQEVFRKAKGEPLLDKNGRPVRFRPRYRYTTWFAVGGTNEWRSYTHGMPRHPNSREITEDVRYIRIMLYPFWPPGEYWYDNVRVVETGPAPNHGRPEADEADFEEGKVVR